MRQTCIVVRKLIEQRQIEPESPANVGHRFLRGGTGFGRHVIGGIPRRELQHEETERDDDEHRRDRLNEVA